ncbi:MAG: hypothetical protein R3E95_20995 [Thiolinea sp.]
MKGKLYAVAMSPDGEQVAVAGWTGQWDVTDTIYIFQRSSGALLTRIRDLPMSLTTSPFPRMAASWRWHWGR